MNKNLRVPYGLSVHGNEEIKAVTNVLKSSTQMGKNVSLFEKKISKLFEKKYGLMVNSGSSAILLAMETLDFPPGSEIITPILTFSTTVGYIVRNNWIPVFVDVEEGTYCVNENKIKNLISKKTKAILAPHLMGNIVNWKKLHPILKRKLQRDGFFKVIKLKNTYEKPSEKKKRILQENIKRVKKLNKLKNRI